MNKKQNIIIEKIPLEMEEKMIDRKHSKSRERGANSTYFVKTKRGREGSTDAMTLTVTRMPS